MAKKEAYLYPEILKKYLEHLEGLPDVKRKGAAMPYTSINGHMFSFLDSAGYLALRLPEVLRNDFLKSHHTSLVEAHGKFLKEYVQVPQKLFMDNKKMSNYFRVSYDYVRSLKPKS